MLTQQEKGDLGPKRDIDGMGVPEIKYGDSVCFIMHVATGLWLSYMAPDAKSSRLGPLKRRVSKRNGIHFTCPPALFKGLVLLQQMAVDLVNTVQLSHGLPTLAHFNRLNQRNRGTEGVGLDPYPTSHYDKSPISVLPVLLLLLLHVLGPLLFLFWWDPKLDKLTSSPFFNFTLSPAKLNVLSGFPVFCTEWFIVSYHNWCGLESPVVFLLLIIK